MHGGNSALSSVAACLVFLLALVCRKPDRAASIVAVALGLCAIAYLSLPVFKSPIHTYMTIVFGTIVIFLTGLLLTIATNHFSKHK